MISLYQLTTPATACSYLPDRWASTQYLFVGQATPAEYQERLTSGWRRFGRALFRPVCQHCRACQSLRIPTATFRPDRSQRRAARANADVDLRIGVPAATPEKLRLYDRFHEFQAESKGWSNRGPKEADEYAESFVDNPFTTEEWCYYVRGRLIGVGYVDALPLAMSAIYFYYDPDERDRGLGTYNVLRILASAADRGVPYLYLGYFVAGCRSLEYKARFQPNEVLQADGSWAAFRD